MNIADHYDYFSEWREEVSHRTKKRIKDRVNKKKEENYLQTEEPVSTKPIIERKRLSEKERKRLKDYQLREFSHRRENGKLLIEQIWKGDLIVRNEYHYNGKLQSKTTLDKDGNEISSEYFPLKAWFINDVEPEDFSDGVGEILKEYKENLLNTMKKEKRQILDRLHKESTKKGYISFGGYSHNFGLSRVGDSYIYDVPAKKTGNLREFRNQKIRVICVGSGSRFIRSYSAGPIL